MLLFFFCCALASYSNVTTFNSSYSIDFSQDMAAIIMVIIMRKFCCSEHGIPKGKCIEFGSKFPNRINYF